MDIIWTDIWEGDITNPLTVIEQLTYLMFICSLDEKELEAEEFEHMTGEKMDKIFPKSAVGVFYALEQVQKQRSPRDLRRDFSAFFQAIKNMKYGRLPDFNEQVELMEVADDSGSNMQNKMAFVRYMSDAMFLVPTSQVLQKIITGQKDQYGHSMRRRVG